MSINQVVFVVALLLLGAARGFSPPVGRAPVSSTQLFGVGSRVTGLVGRFREKKTPEQPRTIVVGDSLPDDVDVILCQAADTKDDDGEDKEDDSVISIREAVGKGKALLIGTKYKKKCHR